MTQPVNAARGEVLLEIDGAPRRLCLTLGALAELEAAFDAANLKDLGERLAALSPSDLIVILAALTAGGGAALSPAEIARSRIDVRAASAAVAKAFRLAFDDP